MKVTPREVEILARLFRPAVILLDRDSWDEYWDKHWLEKKCELPHDEEERLYYDLDGTRVHCSAGKAAKDTKLRGVIDATDSPVKVRNAA